MTQKSGGPFLGKVHRNKCEEPIIFHSHVASLVKRLTTGVQPVVETK
jgi:hypothetical protein